MWLILGAFAIAFTLTNIMLFIRGKDYRVMMVLALLFTSLSLASELSLLVTWIGTQPVDVVTEVAPIMSRGLWTIGIISIIFNSIPLLMDLNDDHKKKQKS